MASESMSAVLLRRWYIVIAGLVLTAGLALLTLQAVPPSYQAKASVLLLSPPANSGDNPYLDMSGLSALADVTATRVSDQATDQVLGTSGTFTIVRDQTTSAPILLIIAKDKTAAGALKTATAVGGYVPNTLAGLQRSANVPAKAYVTANPLAVDKTASKVVKSQLRALLAVAILGIILTLLIAAVIDRSILRRRRRQRAATDPDAQRERRGEAGESDSYPTRSSRPGRRRSDGDQSRRTEDSARRESTVPRGEPGRRAEDLARETEATAGRSDETPRRTDTRRRTEESKGRRAEHPRAERGISLMSDDDDDQHDDAPSEKPRAARR